MLPEVSGGAHMGHPDFRVGGKIFATLWPDEERAVVKLSPEVQAVMVEAELCLARGDAAARPE